MCYYTRRHVRHSNECKLLRVFEFALSTRDDISTTPPLTPPPHDCASPTHEATMKIMRALCLVFILPRRTNTTLQLLCYCCLACCLLASAVTQREARGGYGQSPEPPQGFPCSSSIVWVPQLATLCPVIAAITSPKQQHHVPLLPDEPPRYTLRAIEPNSPLFSRRAPEWAGHRARNPRARPLSQPRSSASR